MENVNVQYLNLLQDVLTNGTKKETRSGVVYSVFDRNIKINMKDGFPLINTKKLFIRGSIHEMLWMLSGGTNIKYLLENNVHIWDGDAYRWYCKLIDEHNLNVQQLEMNNKLTNQYCSINKLDKDEFLSKCLKSEKINILYKKNNVHDIIVEEYYYGDLGPVYGKQWRSYGINHIDQIQRLIDLLKNNPDDRRLLCNAWNPSDMDEMALPPCHYAFQLYTRELSFDERAEILMKVNSSIDTINLEVLDSFNIPKRELSLKWYQRSCDLFLGIPLNISGYALILSLFAHCANMTTGTLSGSFGDCHIYEAHINAVKEQIERNPLKYNLPTLRLNQEKNNIFDFTINDIMIENYQSYPKISAPLCVG